MSIAKRAREDSVPGSLAQQVCKFIDESPTPFHACAEMKAMLVAHGFTELDERDEWRNLLKPGCGYFFLRNGSTIVAFFVGKAFVAGNGFSIVGTHTDSPVLKLKPSSKKTAHGYLQLNVETYGGGLWHTWFDRELTLAGAVIVKESDGTFAKKLVFVRRPLLRVPSLCIHLQSADERAKFGPNKETHLMPILGLIESTLGTSSATHAGSADDADSQLGDRHAPELLKMLATELGCTPGDVLDFELSLCDTQTAQIWGLHDELLSSPRLDNQIHCFTGLRALLDHAAAALPSQPDIAVLASFDHEEVGSESAWGAGSTVMAETLERLTSSFAAPTDAADAARRAARLSFFVSADTAHAVHPNWAEKHQAAHAPHLNQGTVIKTNDNQRYATNGESGFFVRALARQVGVPVQEFMVRNDCPCGSTIGPMIAARTGMRTVDLGVPSLSMHSIRETIGVADIDYNHRLLKAFYASFHELDDKCNFTCRPCPKPK